MLDQPHYFSSYTRQTPTTPPRTHRAPVSDELYQYLQTQELCRSVSFVHDLDQVSGEVIATYMTPRCERPEQCRVCARLEVRKVIRAAKLAAKPTHAVTITEIMSRKTPDTQVWETAQSYRESIHRHLKRRVGTAPEYVYVIQRGHADRMIHFHWSAHHWQTAHTTALHEITAKRGIDRVSVERITSGWTGYLFAEVTSGDHVQHMTLNNPPGSSTPRIEHHTRNFYRGMSKRTAMTLRPARTAP